MAPKEYIRKQTLVNAERYITPEMKEYETLVLNAEDRIREIEGACSAKYASQIWRAQRHAAEHRPRPGRAGRWPRWPRPPRWAATSARK
jgi:hypothetical protein